jgi:hypothetical protein
MGPVLSDPPVGSNVELSENERAEVCNLHQRYWLYVVYDCANSHPSYSRSWTILEAARPSRT